MNDFSKEMWIPTNLSLPDSSRIVLIQIAELPDPSIGSYWADKGKWVFEEKDYEEITNPTVLAWRDMPSPYKPEKPIRIFRSAAETRTLTFSTLKAIKEGSYDKEFNDIREAVLHACLLGNWCTDVVITDEKNLAKLKEAGFIVTESATGYHISWLSL